MANTESLTRSDKRSTTVRVLRMLAVVLLLGIVSVSVLLGFVLSNPERIKAALETFITGFTDRPFRVEGEFEISLGSEIDIRATQVKWENPAWSTRPNMLEIGEIGLHFSLLSLLEQPIVITDSQVRDARVVFEWTNENEFNWKFFPDEKDDADSGPDDGDLLEPLPLLLNKAALTNVDVVFDAPVFTEPLVWHINYAEQEQDASNLLVISASTLLDNRPLALQGRVGPFPELIVGGATRLAARAQSPVQFLAVTGSTDRLLNLAGLEFDITWKAEDVTRVLETLNLPDATTGAVDLAASLRTEKNLLVGDIDGSIGQFKIDGKLSAPETDTFSDLHAELTSTGPNGAALGALAGIDGLPLEPYQLSLKADSIAGGVRIEKFSFLTADAQLSVTGLLPQAPTLIDADIDLRLTGKNLSRFQKMSADITFIEQPFSADLKLLGNGAGNADTLEGQLTLAQMTGDISARLTERSDYVGSEIKYSLVFPDSQRVYGMLNIPLTSNEELTVAGGAKIQDGGVELDDLKLAIQTNSAVLNGRIPWPGRQENIEFTARTSGQEFSNFTGLFLPFELGPALPFSLEGKYKIDDRNILKIVNKGTVGTTQLDLSSRITLGAAAKTDSQISIQASGSDLDEWLQDKIAEARVNDSFSLSTEISLTDTELAITEIDFAVRGANIRGDVRSGWPDEPEKIDFDLTASGKNLAEELPKFNLYEPASVSFDLRAKGRLDETRIHIDYFDGNIGSASLEVQGDLQIPPAIESEQLTLEISGDNVSELGRIEGFELAPNHFAVSAKVSSSGNVIEASNFSIVLGPNDLSGSIRVDTAGKTNISSKLVSRNIEIGATLTPEQGDALSDMLDSEDDTGEGRVIPDAEFPIELLREFDADLQADIGRIEFRGDALSELSITGNLTDGALQIPDVRAATTLGNVRAQGAFTPAAGLYRLEFRGEANNVRFQRTKEMASDVGAFKGYDLDWNITGTGTDVRALAASADGYFWMRGGEWRMENVKYSSLFGDAFTEIGQMINPFYKKDPYTNIVCEAYFFEIEDGVMESAPVALIKTDKVNVIAGGGINLKTERIKMGIETNPRKGIGISASDLFTPFVRIGGTMAEPKAVIDPTGSLIEGGAAFYTAGLSILAKGLYQRWIKEDKSCDDYAGLARKARDKRAAKNVPAD